MEETVIQRKPTPRNIRGGYILLVVASVMFFLDAIVQVFEVVRAIVEQEVVWTETMSVISFLKSPVLFIFFIFGGIAGIAFVRNKTFMAGWVGLVAILCFFFFVFDFFDSLLQVLKTSDYARFFSSLLSVQMDTSLYLVGWFVSKDYFED